MKNFYTTMLCIGLFAIASPAALAQSADVDVTATVQANITATTAQDVDFGNIQASSDPVIDPNGENAEVGTTAQFGRVDITASNSTDIIISYDAGATLGDGSGSTLSFTADIAGNTTDDAANSTDFTSESSVTTSSTGNYYVYVGGDLGTLTDQTTGSYSTAVGNGSGPLTVTVSYQ